MLQLTLPEQSLSSLSFCDPTPRSFREWVIGLPLVNVGETSRRLYHAITELNKLVMAGPQRLALLDLIRPPIHYICKELSRHFLGHSISLPEKHRKIANLAQALQLHLATGYKQALTDLLKARPAEKNRHLVAHSAQRAIAELSGTVLRAAQLYCSSPTHSWLECHQIFRCISAQELDDFRIEDDTDSHSTITSVTETYKRLLLLGCCRSNQLRQNELDQVYGAFRSWAQHTEFSTDSVSDALFIVDAETDAPPVYRGLITGPLKPKFSGFHTIELAYKITTTLNARAENKPDPKLLPMPETMSDTLLMHLSQALGILTKRAFRRLTNENVMDVCVGMSAAHYYSAGETEFKQFVGNPQPAGERDNVFLTRARDQNDPWSRAHDTDPLEGMVSPDTPITFRSVSDRSPGQVDPETKYQRFAVPLLNTSPGGYCLHWDKAAPPALQAGEIVAVREQRHLRWSLAIVRWIRQLRQQNTQVGVELLAPNAVPCAIRLIHKDGHSSEYLRGLLLPALGSIGQATTLIAPRLPFQTGNRVMLLHEGKEEDCQLGRRVSVTGSVSQFELAMLSTRAAEPTATAKKRAKNVEDDFDSLWPSL